MTNTSLKDLGNPYQQNLDPSLLETGDILQLKHLFTNHKQQYERNLHSLNQQLQEELAKNQALQKEFEDFKNHHKEELQALRQQQLALRELLKKNQEELKNIKENTQESASQTQILSQQQKIQQLERVIPYLRERTEEAHLETDQLREELEKAYHNIEGLQNELSQARQEKDRHLQEFLTTNQFEASKLAGLNEQIGQEIEKIKQSFAEGAPEARLLESRYLNLFQEKLVLEQQLKQMQVKLEYQSSNLVALQNQVQSTDLQKKQFEKQLLEKETRLDRVQKEFLLLESKNQKLTESLEDKSELQEKYEQLKDETNLLTERLEAVLDVRMKSEQQLEHLAQLTTEQEATLIEQYNQINEFKKEQENLIVEIQQLQNLVGENEGQLKVAQQHLAKKVKEAALLAEKVEEQQILLTEHQQRFEMARGQINQLQINIEIYQKQEKKLQEQLHEALKSTEGQVSKWEEKYFKMYDKWQESETYIRDLKKFEEKYQQMQSLLANLGTFMGASVNPAAFIAPASELEKFPKRLTAEAQSEIAPQPTPKPESNIDERYDVFGMKLPQEKLKYTPPHE